MKRYLGVLLFVLSLHEAISGDSPLKMLEALPAKVGVFSARAASGFDDPRLGAARGYNSADGTTITIYIYDLGVKTIAHGITDETVRKAFHQAKADIAALEKRGTYRDVKMGQDLEFEIETGPGRTIKFLGVTYTFTIVDPDSRTTQRVASKLMITGLRKQRCKIRVTRPPSSDADGQDSSTVVLTSLITALSKD